MRIPVTDRLLEEAVRFRLRSACPDCFFYVVSDERCAHGWPNEEQRHRLPDALDMDGDNSELSAPFCKEFELR